MTDGVIKSTGNSRYLKSVANFMSLYPTYEDFVAALVAGTLPVDLNGINPNGWSTQGTPLNKANLLTDYVSNLLNLGSTGTVDKALRALKTSLDSFPSAAGVCVIDYGSCSYSNTTGLVTIYTSGSPKCAVLINQHQPAFNSLVVSIVGGATFKLRKNEGGGGDIYIDSNADAPTVSGNAISLNLGGSNYNSYYFFALGRK